VSSGRSASIDSTIADAVFYVVTRDRRVAVNEILVRAAEQG
jgi:NADP-dependent 3-hydroxy acid dehydrogenase YdfG